MEREIKNTGVGERESRSWSKRDGEHAHAVPVANSKHPP
jgi:hypothetical protein